MAGRLAPASEVAGGHTIPFLSWQTFLKLYGMSSDPATFEAGGHQVQILLTRALN
jgi:hypothetical protein